MKASILKNKNEIDNDNDVQGECIWNTKKHCLLCNSLSLIYHRDMGFPWFLVWCHGMMTCAGSKTYSSE